MQRDVSKGVETDFLLVLLVKSSGEGPPSSFVGIGKCCDKGGDLGSEGNRECSTGLWCRKKDYIYSRCRKSCAKGICVKQSGVSSCHPKEKCNYNCLSGYCNSNNKCE